MYVPRETYLRCDNKGDEQCCGTLFHMEQAIETFISNHPDWTYQDHKLVGEWKLESFTQLRRIVVQLCDLADEYNHHPTVTFGYNTLHVETTTHDAGNSVTEKDLHLAQAITSLLGE